MDSNQDLLQRGIQKGLIAFDESKEYITYIPHNKTRKYTNPEEKTQALCFLKLVLEYGYPAEHIVQFVPVQMGVSKKEADIIVYTDSSHSLPYIVVECKKQDISDLALNGAVEQAFSYAVSESASFVWVSSSIKDIYFEVLQGHPKSRDTIVDIPRFGRSEVAEYKFVRGGKRVDENGDEEKFFDLKEVSQGALKQRFISAHDALWGGGELHPSQAFDELDKLLFCKLLDETITGLGEPYGFQIYTYKINGEKADDEYINKELAKRVKQLYEQGKKKDPEVFKEDIRLSPAKIRVVVGYLQEISLSKTDLDSKGRAFESFMDSFFRGHFGQYFTPRNIIKFIVDSLPITNQSFVLDTSCGSGGFLLHSLDKVRKQADKKFPEEAREKDRQIYNSYHSYWHSFAEKYLYGIEINEQIARVAKMNMIVHDDGHTNVIAYDGLSPISPKEIPDEIKKLPIDNKERREKEAEIEKYNKVVIFSQNSGFKENHFDFIITNPPFGSVIKQTEKAYLKEYNMGYSQSSWLDLKPYRKEKSSQNTEVLFIEQAYNFLKEKGILAIVIPDGILTNSTMQYVRDNIEEMYRIIAVISMPQFAFSQSEAGVKSSVLFLQKHTAAQSEKIKSLKLNLQNDIKTDEKYEQETKELELQKKQEIKELESHYTKEQRKGAEFQQKRDVITQKYKERIESLRDELTQSYQEQKSKIFAEQGLDYDIFMAIAEDIGYDATGKPTGNNELDSIAKELEKFIAALV